MIRDILDKRIPTLLGILIITVGVGVTTYLVNQGGLLKSNAGPSQQPQNVRITNITDSSFSVSYITADSVIGSLNYGKGTNLGQSALDDKDQQSGNYAGHKVHNITVRNLIPGTKYYFAIISAQQTYLNNSQDFEVTTGPPVSDSPPKQDPISGKIILPSGNPPSEAIVYVTTNGAQVISALVKSDGTYILPLNSLRSDNLANYYTIPTNADVQMLVIGDDLESSILLSAGQAHPVPIITISKNYDFRTSSTPVTSSPTNTESFPSFTSTTSAQTAVGDPTISTPKQNQSFTDQQPQFKGTAQPNENVQIIIHSDQQLQTQVTTDSSGNWNYRPSTPLSPGEHTIYIITKNAEGIVKTISQSFVVYAQGSQIQQPGTVSITLTPTPTTSPSPTPSPSITPVATITPSQMPTVTPTLTITPVASNNAVISPTPPVKLPPTGDSNIMTIGIIGVISALAGGLLFLFSRSASLL